jgi:RNA recognition motif-containing protein
VILDSGADEIGTQDDAAADASSDYVTSTMAAPCSGTCIAQTVVVSGLHHDATEHDIRAVLQDCGVIVAVRIQPRAKSRVAFVDFATKTAAKKATKISGEGLLICKQAVSIKPSRTTNKDRLLRAYADAFMEQPPVALEAPKVKASDISSCHTVIVKNIDYNADEDSIRKYFSKCGQIKAVRTFKEKDTGAFKGLTYIEFSEGGKPATKAVSCNGELFFGRPLKIDYAASAEDVLKARYEHFRALKKGGKPKSSSKNANEKHSNGGNRVTANNVRKAGIRKNTS